jgi:hypothetical protein
MHARTARLSSARVRAEIFHTFPAAAPTTSRMAGRARSSPVYRAVEPTTHGIEP